MVAIKKMRLPLSAEYAHLAEFTHESDVWMNWSTALSWCKDEDPIHHALRKACGGTACKNQAFIPDDTRAETVGFRPAFEVETDIPDGQITIVGTLFMNGMPVKVPTCLKNTTEYIPGAKLELQPALEDENFQVRAIRAGDALIADRVMLKNITWDECKGEVLHEETAPMCSTPAKKAPVKIKSVRLPTSREWDRMIDVMVGVNSQVHWKGSFSWCLDSDPNVPGRRTACGLYAGRYTEYFKGESRLATVGFRPTFAIEDSEGIPEGETTVVGTLFMNGMPVLANHDGALSVPEYIPGARLEFREAVDDPRYHVKAIKASCTLIGDRILLRNISWDDLDKLGFCGDAHKTSKGETKMKKDQTIIYLGDTAREAFAIACSKKNEQKVLSFMSKWYPEWAKAYEGRGTTLWLKVHDAIKMMKDLLEDENMEVLGMSDKVVIRLEDEVYGACAVACSRKNEQKVKAFLTKRYPKWSARCVGKSGLTPWNNVLDAVEDMKELLGDDNLQFLDGCKDILIPADPIQN